MIERIAAANCLPVDDAKRAPFVFRVTLDAVLATKGCVQTTRMKSDTMTGQALLIRDTTIRLMAFRAAVGIIISRVPFVQGTRRHAKETLRPRNRRRR